MVLMKPIAKPIGGADKVDKSCKGRGPLESNFFRVKLEEVLMVALGGFKTRLTRRMKQTLIFTAYARRMAPAENPSKESLI